MSDMAPLVSSASFDSLQHRRPKTSERIAHRIIDHIVDNQLSEGTQLPTESELGTALDVGRSTLREALLLLETWGVITVKAGRNGGPVVRRPRPDDLREALALQLHFASASLNDVAAAREAIEPWTARLAATRITSADIDTLQETVDAIRGNDGPTSYTVFLEQNRRFHSLIAEATDNVVLHTFVDSMKAISDGAAVGVQYGRRQQLAVAEAHERIVHALRSNDPDDAEAEMRRHLREAREYWEGHADKNQRGLRWVGGG